MDQSINPILNYADREFLKNRFTLLCYRLMELNDNQFDNPPILKWWELLDQHYSALERTYHNWRHIIQCLREFDQAAHYFDSPLAAEIAIWFHDMIYAIPPDPVKSNETLSSQQAAVFLLDFNTKSNKLIQMVADDILTTDHDPDRPIDGLTSDQKLLCSIDLLALGQPWDKYAAYAQAIHLEYAKMGFEAYCLRRAEFLERFLKRSHIYPAHIFRKTYEDDAVRNMQREIDCLNALMIPTAEAD